MTIDARRVLPGVAAAAIVVAAAAGYWFYLREPAPEPPPPPAAAQPQAPVREPTVVAPPAEVPLPRLDESDAAVRGWLADVIGAETVERFLVPEAVVRKLVATVDNLPRKKLDTRVRVVRALEGQFPVERAGDELFLGPETYARYEPFIQAVRMADPDNVADLYLRVYPLLHQAYEELGYPGRQFHVRVLEAIDDALAAPEIEGPVRLVQPHVFYEFADSDLEARSAGQKILIRIGPVHAAVIREKLTALRAALVARSTAAP